MGELQKSLKASSPSSGSLLLLLLCLSMTATTSMAATRIAVGVILDLNSTLGKMVNYSLGLAVEDYYSDNDRTATKIELIVQHVPQNDVVAAAGNASALINNENVSAILGPQNSEQARQIVKLGEKSKVPVIWFPITGPSLSPPPYPYSDQGLHCYQFQAIAEAVKALGWHSIVPIYEDTEYGNQLISCLPNLLKDTGIRMANVTAIDPKKVTGIRVANVTAIIGPKKVMSKAVHLCYDPYVYSILEELNKTRLHVFLVHMNMDLGKQFILSAQRYYMMDKGYAWILTQELSSLTDPRVTVRQTLKGYMQGALGVKPIDISDEKTSKRRWTELDFRDKFNMSLTIYGWWAYHTLEALAMAVESLGKDHNNGTKLRSEMLATNFTGSSGLNFNLKNEGEQLNQSEYEIYNVIGQKERVIGSWKRGKGLVQDYGSGVGGGEASRKYQLEYPLWPGYTFDKPPKLRIGVPTNSSFPELVNANIKPRIIRGFAVNVFSKVVDLLPFPFNEYEFVPLSNELPSSGAPMYDDILCNQMKEEDLDAIIGDITIVANRTECVDFTLPYLDSSVAMVVRIVNASTSKGILLKPFKWTLWLILGGIFVIATIIIIILERNKTNQEGSETNQEASKTTQEGSETNQEASKTTQEESQTNQEESATNQAASKTTQEESETNRFFKNPFLVYKIDVMEINDASKAAGWMVILTSFLFILVVQVYTANLTSILTKGTDKEPSYKDENEMVSKNLLVGYRNGSWVKGFLIEQLGFKDDQLKPFGSREEYNEALSKGTKKGGVDAIFDETPYLTLFLSKYKSRFMMTGTIFKTGGFAFAFPKKSGLVSDFSKAILNVTTHDVEAYRVLMAKSSLPTSVEDLEFEDKNDRNTPSLSIANFGGLYPVLLSVLALFICLSIPLVIKWLRGKSQLPSKSPKP